MTNNLSLIVAISENNAIGKNGDLLCHLPADMRHFKEITTGHTVIMGRKTFESLPKGALPNRKNIIVTRNKEYKADNCIICFSLKEALSAAGNETERFIIGGAQLYDTAVQYADTFYLTRIHASFADADTFFPEIDYNEWEEVTNEYHGTDDKNKIPYSFITLKRKKAVL